MRRRAGIIRAAARRKTNGSVVSSRQRPHDDHDSLHDRRQHRVRPEHSGWREAPRIRIASGAVRGDVDAWAILTGANARAANFDDADLSEADLEGAKLQVSTFHGATLRSANLRAAHASGASFAGADLSGANLSGCDIGHARFEGAKLEGADMRCLRIETATFTDASFDERTIWPDGFAPQRRPI
jgi:uncharacterized protein YjbI with pentapeptide repeats